VLIIAAAATAGHAYTWPNCTACATWPCSKKLARGGNRRNTTIVRSNYLWDESTHL